MGSYVTRMEGHVSCDWRKGFWDGTLLDLAGSVVGQAIEQAGHGPVEGADLEDALGAASDGRHAILCVVKYVKIE